MPDEVFRQERMLPPSEGGVEISGNVPPQFKQMLQAAKRGEQMLPQTEQHEQPKQREMPRMTPQGVQSGSLTKLLDRLDVTTFETISLPSRGFFYDNEILRSGQLHVRPMTGAEEEILATPRHVRKNEAIDMIFKRCIQESIDPTDLLTIDRNYLLIWLRGISYDSLYEVKVKCPSCENTFDTEINLSLLPVEQCPDDFTTVNLTGTLPKTGCQFSYRLSTGKDEVSILQYRERQAKKFAGSTDDTLTFRTSLLLNNIEDVNDTKSLQILLKRLPISDVAYLRSLINEPPFGVDTDVGLVCSVCGHEFSIDLPLEASFFFPSFKKKERE
jgi:hypothetical protein